MNDGITGKDALKYFGTLVALPAGVCFLWGIVAGSNYSPRVKGNNPVVFSDDGQMIRSLGYDFDGDGKLDFARADCGYGRGAGSITLSKRDPKFEELQAKYNSQFTIPRQRR